MSFRSVRPAWTLASALALALLASSACTDGETGGIAGIDLFNPAPTAGGTLTVTCELAVAQVSVGSTTPVVLIARVSRNGVAASGVLIAFTTTGGTLNPALATSDANGTATSSLVPPGVAGPVVVTATAASDARTTSSCGLTVVASSTRARLQVTLAAPPRLAGLTITVLHDPTDVTINSSTTLGPLAAADCVNQVAAPSPGRLVATLACPTLRAAAGSEVLRVDATGATSVLTNADFNVTCAGVDEAGAPVGTSCSVVVTQI